jgi:urea carboxylase
VSERELLKLRAEFPLGRYRLRIDETTFSLPEYNRFLDANALSIEAFKQSQQAAFDAERERWRAAGQAEYHADAELAEPSDAAELPANACAVATPVSGVVWKVPATLGSAVDKGELLVIVESMKMEINVLAPCAGKVAHIYCQQGSTVSAGQRLIALGL